MRQKLKEGMVSVMTRTQLRENTFKLLFCKEFHNKEDMEEQFKLYLADFEKVSDGESEIFSDKDREFISEEEKQYITEKVNKIIELTENIDAKINEVSVGWKTDRMGKVELSILRLAYYEMNYDEEVPKKVAIDQAVELAKKYGSDTAPGFINGILAKLF